MSLNAHNGGVRLPATTGKGWTGGASGKKDKKAGEKHGDDLSQSVQTVADLVPREVILASANFDESSALENRSGNSWDVFQHLAVDLDTAKALQDCNITDTAWSEEIIEAREYIATEGNDVDPRIIDPGFHPPSTEDNFGPDPDPITEEAVSVGDKQPSSSDSTELNMHTTFEGMHSTSVVISAGDSNAILAMLQSDGNANKKGIWDHRDSSFVKKACSSPEGLSGLRDVDLRVVSRFLNQRGLTKIKPYSSKREKISKLCEVFGYTNPENNQRQTRRNIKKQPVKTLSDLATRTLTSKVPKMALNVAYAEYIWPVQLAEWQRQSPISDTVKVQLDEVQYPDFWFYIPEFSETRQKLEVRCIDSSHLLTRCRRKICKGGLEGMDNKPWVNVALEKTTFLTLVMVEDVVDPMSVSMAATHISGDVERIMIRNGDFQAASLCRDLRSWWQSEDDPGISANDRIVMRMNLRQRLLNYVDFAVFPPATMHINGWPLQLWEALIANIDAKSMLYPLCKGGTYNVRAFSSMMGETFFSELTNQDRRGHGTVSAPDFAYFIGNSIEQMHIRLDATR